MAADFFSNSEPALYVLCFATAARICAMSPASLARYLSAFFLPLSYSPLSPSNLAFASSIAPLHVPRMIGSCSAFSALAFANAPSAAACAPSASSWLFVAFASATPAADAAAAARAVAWAKSAFESRSTFSAAFMQALCSAAIWSMCFPCSDPTRPLCAAMCFDTASSAVVIPAIASLFRSQRLPSSM